MEEEEGEKRNIRKITSGEGEGDANTELITLNLIVLRRGIIFVTLRCTFLAFQYIFCNIGTKTVRNTQGGAAAPANYKVLL